MLTAQEAYDAVSGRYDMAFTRHLDQAEDELTFARLAHLDGQNVLDLGCGTGLYLSHCHPSFYTGVDISEGMLKIARQKFSTCGQARFLRGDMANLPQLLSMHYDAVVSTFGSFSYCEDPALVASEVYRLLRPGGFFSIMTLGRRYRQRASHILAGMPVPMRYYDAKTLHRIFKDFEQVQVRGLVVLGDLLAPWLGPLVKPYLFCEQRTLARLWPDDCFCLTVSGIKPCRASI